MYADDTAICVITRDKAGVTKLMQDMTSLMWITGCVQIRLSLHIGKTSWLLVASAQHRWCMYDDHLDLSLNDNQIDDVKASPYLCIIKFQHADWQ